MLARSRSSPIPCSTEAKAAVVYGVSIWNADDLQAIDLHLFIAQHADARSCNGVQEFTVIAELLVISCHEIHSLRSQKFLQRLCRSLSVNGSAVVQIAGNKDCIRLFLQDLRDHALQESAVADVVKMHVADQRRFPSAPRVRQIRETDGRTRDPRTAGVQEAVDSNYDRSHQQHFYEVMKVDTRSRQSRCAQN